MLLISLQDNDTVGLKYLHYSLLNAGQMSSILYLPDLEADIEEKLRGIGRFLAETRPEVIGIGLMSTEYHKACRLTEYIKNFDKKIPVIWGGVHPTISPESCLKYADFVCMGEGEKVILDIANIKSLTDIKDLKNICYNRGGEIKRNELYPLVEDLDAFPFCEHVPRRAFIMENNNVVPLNKKLFKKHLRYEGSIYSIITTRGCPFYCTYCCNNHFSRLYGPGRIRRRSVENILKELEIAVRDNPEIEYINFLDDCFLAFGSGYLKDFCKAYKERIGKPFVIRTIPIYVTEEKMRSLKDAGLAWVTLGLQSGSDKVCKDIYNRKSFKADFLKAAVIVKKFNIAAFYDVITDNPLESTEDRLNTIEVLMETPKPFYLDLFSLTLYQGTELYDRIRLECPEKLEDFLKKDYSVCKHDDLNRLIRLAGYIGRGQMNKVVRLYRDSPDSLGFKVYLSVLENIASLIVQPVTYFHLIRLSQGGSYVRTLKVLPSYFKKGVDLYIKQFHKKAVKTASA